MGYIIHQGETQFKIPRENFKAAFDALTPLIEEGLAWDRKEDATDLIHRLINLRWEPKVEKSGIVGLSFTGEKQGDEDSIFMTIAPFVEDGSFITVSGEDGDVWRYVFDGQRCTIVLPEW